MMSDKITVSVCMTAYNSGRFIEQAVRSILKQHTDFQFELLIGDDHSLDDTGEIIKRLAEEKSNVNCDLVYVYQEKNLGAMANADVLFRKARGKYIALCEADDFWQDEMKLQIQVDSMEINAKAMICFHAVKIVNESGEIVSIQRFSPKIVPSFQELMKNNFISTPTTMYRNIFDPLVLPWMKNLAAGDWPMHLRHAERGDILYIDQPMASYRVHAAGIWSQADANSKRLKWITVVDMVIVNLFPQYEYSLNYTKKNCLLALSTSHFFSGHLILAGKYLCRALSLKTDPPMSFWVLIKIASNKLRKEFLKTIDKINA